MLKINGLIIKTTQDEHNQHVVLVTINGVTRIFSRWYSSHVISRIAHNLERRVSYGFDASEFANLPIAEYRITKSGKKLLLAK